MSLKNTLFWQRTSHSALNVVVEIMIIMIAIIRKHDLIIVPLLKLIVPETINLPSSQSINWSQL